MKNPSSYQVNIVASRLPLHVTCHPLTFDTYINLGQYQISGTDISYLERNSYAPHTYAVLCIFLEIFLFVSRHLFSPQLGDSVLDEPIVHTKFVSAWWMQFEEEIIFKKERPPPF